MFKGLQEMTLNHAVRNIHCPTMSVHEYTVEIFVWRKQILSVDKEWECLVITNIHYWPNAICHL